MLIITFDIDQPDVIGPSYAVGTILAHFKMKEPNRVVEYYSINLSDVRVKGIESIFFDLSNHFSLVSYEYIAISAYIWSEPYINSLIQFIHSVHRTVRIILGGYQIAGLSISELNLKYPDVYKYIEGYSEKAILNIANNSLDEIDTQQLINMPIDGCDIYSPYLTNIYRLYNNIKKVRLETKRGCPYRCSFCSHDVCHSGKVIEKNIDYVISELNILKKYSIGKINIIDPVFNCGKNYKIILQEIAKYDHNTAFTLQYKLNEKLDFNELELIACSNICLEIGIQTLDDEVLKNISRPTNVKNTINNLIEINSIGIDTEVSLIYGLPGQTLKIFIESIEVLKKIGLKKIKAYPLMLLRGTKLFLEKQKWGLVEGIDEFGIPIVKKSNTFSEEDWESMNELALKI